ncbi:MAG: oligopeptidase B, partial [Chitinophagaceae bacterium]|nr:oligopeptidase B [Chitinophagaceae bacterium]
MEKQPYRWPENITPPVAEKKPMELKAHGDVRIDEYYWMNDYFKKGPDSSKVLDYLNAENEYLEKMMSGLKNFREKLYEEMKARIKEKDESVPYYYNGYYYYTRTEEGKQYFKFCRKKGTLDAPEEILLDVDKMAEGHEYYAVAGLNVSPDNKWMAFGVDTVSRRQYSIYFKNLETGETIDDGIKGTSGSAVWAADSKTVFYTENNPNTLLSEKIKRHVVGTPATADKVVYHEKDPSNYIGVDKTRSEKYIVIISSATLSSEVRILEASDPTGEFRIFQPRIKDVLYNIEHWNDRFLVHTNMDAKNFRLMETPENKTGRENWKEMLAHRQDVLLEGVDAFRNFLILVERKEGLLNIRIRKPDGEDHELNFGEPAYDAYPGANPDYNTNVFRYHYTSLTTPNSVFDYNVNTREKKLMKQQEV